MTLTLVNLHVLGGNIAPSNSSSKLQSRWSNVIFPDTNGVWFQSKVKRRGYFERKNFLQAIWETADRMKHNIYD